jgi:hypothetical protein
LTITRRSIMADTSALPAVGTVGHVVHPFKGDWGKLYRVVGMDDSKSYPCLILESVARLRRMRYAQDSDLGPDEKHLAGIKQLWEENPDLPAESTRPVRAAWFHPDPAAKPPIPAPPVPPQPAPAK